MTLDKQGREFDPEIHEVGEDGEPVLNADGTLRCLRGARLSREETPRRRKRSETGLALRLAAEKRKGDQRRWAVDEPGRISQLNESNDWEFVLDDNGQKISRVTGRDGQGNAQHSYLMEIPEEYYLEDKKERQKRIIDPTKMKESQIGENEYIPGGGNTALR